MATRAAPPIFLAFSALLLCARPAASSQLRNDPTSRCVAYGNGTTFNITALPWSSFSFTDARNYKYVLMSPCAEEPWFACPGFDAASVVLCQKDHLTEGMWYDCGGVTTPPVWLLSQFDRFTVLFGNGNNWRITNVTFIIDPTVDPPVASFVDESPYEQYNVVVRGKCVGQPWGCASDGGAAPFAIDAQLVAAAETQPPGWLAMHANATGGACCEEGGCDDA